MYIDLRSDKLYNPEHQQLYNRIARRNRKAFTNFIGEISKYYKDNLDWWVSMPPSRHIYTSQLFHYYCSLILVRLLLKQKKSNLIIITDSKAFKYVLEKYFAQNKIVVDVDYRVNIAVKIKNFIKIFYLVFLIPLKHIFIFFRIKHLLKNKNNLPKDSITIIDTYIIRDDINDRYYSGLWDTLNKNERKNIYFLPFFCHPINLSTLFQKLQGSNKNFLIKENILKISDYFYAWCHCVRVFRIRINPIYFSGFNFKQLIKQELYSFNIFNSSFEAIINYLFVKRLKEKGIDVRLLIDWFENQVIDKGLILGFRKFYPRVKIKGYQGFIVTKNHLSLYPSEGSFPPYTSAFSPADQSTFCTSPFSALP